MTVPTKNKIINHTVKFESAEGHDFQMVFCRIPACPDGFLMGSRHGYSNERPVHRVRIPFDFWLGQVPVTQKQFSVWTSSSDFRKCFEKPHKNEFDGNPDCPAENITWFQAEQFCRWLTESIKQEHQFPAEIGVARLPLESEWEYACRGDELGKNQTDYLDGDGEISLAHSGWYSQNSQSRTHPVGMKTVNSFGLYDMHGNVWEWCLDRWDALSYRRRWDGISSLETYWLHERHGEQSEDPGRVLRGGSWFDAAGYCRTAFRDWNGAGYSYRVNGLRVCLVPAQKKDASEPRAESEATRNEEQSDSARRRRKNFE